MITFCSLVRDEDGQSMVEYGLILGVIAAICVAGFTTIGKTIKTDLTTLIQNMGGEAAN